MECYRQGDVLVVRISDVPESAFPVPREDGRLVLARGEATGHAHVIDDQRAALVSPAEAEELFLLVYADEVLLEHDEHDPISLPEGKYRVVRQREYSPRRLLTVWD